MDDQRGNRWKVEQPTQVVGPPESSQHNQRKGNRGDLEQSPIEASTFDRDVYGCRVPNQRPLRTGVMVTAVRPFVNNRPLGRGHRPSILMAPGYRPARISYERSRAA